MSDKKRDDRTLSDLTDAQLLCRLRHPMDYIGDTNIVSSRGRVVQYTQIMRCLRKCGYETKTVVDVESGMPVGNAKTSYTDESYLIGERVTKADIRRELSRRRFGKR